MSIEVPFRSKAQLEHEAEILLAEFGVEHGPVQTSPVPVDEILEIHLRLTLEMDDLRGHFGGADVLGALWFNENRVVIDQHLDPDANPDMEGRYHYTCAHEGAHYRVHRPYFVDDSRQQSLFESDVARPSIVCRSTDAKAWIEWQADYFAACLLMPRTLVLDAWHSCFGRVEPVVYEDYKHLAVAQPFRRQGPVLAGDIVNQTLRPEAPFFWRVAKEFAGTFKVSTQAMRIRLQEMGLLLRDHSENDSLFRATG